MTHHEHLTLKNMIEWDADDLATLPERKPARRTRKVRTQTRSARKPQTHRQRAAHTPVWPNYIDNR